MRETVHQGARGILRLQRSESGPLIGFVAGHYGVELLPSYIEAMNAAIRRGPLLMFNDWAEMETYDSECRRVMTEWVIRHRDRVERIHILVRSKLVAMGVTTASLLIGHGLLISYAHRSAFEDALRPHLER